MSNKIKTETRRLWVSLSDEELQGLSQELAQSIQDRNAEEERQKSAKSLMRSALEEFQERQQRIANNIVRKQVERDVEVDLVIAGLQVQEVRQDTGEVILTRPAMPSELQIRFNDEPVDSP